MYTYSPRITHFLMPILIMVTAQATINIENWFAFGIAMYVLGGCVALVIGYAMITEVRIAWHDRTSATSQMTDRDEVYLSEDVIATTNEPVKVEVWDSPTSTRYFDLPASRNQLEQLAVALCISGEKFTQRRWTGKHRPFSINEFVALRDVLLNKQLIYQINEKAPQQGYDLTLSGRAVLEKFLPLNMRELDRFPSPTPSLSTSISGDR